VTTFLWGQFNGFAVMLALLVADHASVPPLNRLWPYPLALVAGVAIGTTLEWLVAERLLSIATAYQITGEPEPFSTFAFRHGIQALAVWGLMTLAYVSWRRATQRQAALRAVQLEGARAEKRVLKLRLAAMRARVEPQFLLDALARVEQLFETDAQAANCMLQDLVTYLRVAIPQIRDPSTTIRREIELANAYLNVVGRQTKDGVLLHGPDDWLGDARIPPMLILPLVNRALARRSACTAANDYLEISAAIGNDRLRITMRDAGNGFAPAAESEECIARIRELLASLFGGNATLTLRASAQGSEAEIDLPRDA
jgi:LytS/YehU family sensor histidine kinase